MMQPMYSLTCGDRNQHWYGKGDYCRCGQVPNRLLAAVRCDCRGARLDPPLHKPECLAVTWANERTEWVGSHPGLDPPLPQGPGTEGSARLGCRRTFRSLMALSFGL